MSRRFPRRLLALASVAVVAAGTAACRDQIAPDDRARAGDRDILGGAALTDAEVRRGWFTSSDADLQPLVDHLRRSFTARARISGNATVFATEEVLDYDPTTGTFFAPAPPAGTPGASPLVFSLPLTQLRDEYVALCEAGRPAPEGEGEGESEDEEYVGGPLFASLPHNFPDEDNPCDFLALGSANDFIDDANIILDIGAMTARWAEPSRTLTCDIEDHFYSEHLDYHRLYPPPRRPPARLLPQVCASDDDCGGDVTCRDGFCQWCRTDADCNETRDDLGPDGVCDRVEGNCDVLTRGSCFGDHDETAPVIELRIPTTVEITSDPGFSFSVAQVKVNRLDLLVRIQARHCVDGGAGDGCVGVDDDGDGDHDDGDEGLARDGRVWFDNYRNDGLGVGFTDVDLHVGAVTTAENIDTEIIPGLAYLNVCVFDPVSCGLFDDLLRDLARAAAVRTAKSVGGVVDTVLSAPVLPRITLTQDLLDQLDEAEPRLLLNERHKAALADRVHIPIGGVSVQLPGETRAQAAPLARVNGSLTNRTVDAVALGAAVIGGTVDVTDLANTCTRVDSVDDPVEFVCRRSETDVRCHACAYCDAMGNLSPPLERVCMETTRPVTPCVVDADCGGAGAGRVCDTSQGHCVTSIADFGADGALFTLPPSPGLAQAGAGAPNIATELRRVFSRPLDNFARRANTTIRYTGALDCSTAPAPAACPPGVTARATFLVRADRDGDGVRDHIDNCPAIPNDGQENVDGDALGDACDHCPDVLSSDESDEDGDGTPNVCDCDADNDFCPNSVIAIDGAGGFVEKCTFVIPDEHPLSYTCDDTPVVPEAPPPLGCWPTNSDREIEEGDGLAGDGIPDDCDDDDDDDGRLDVDDNCRVEDNFDQADQNEDGIGDACDLACPGDGGPLCGPPPEGMADGADLLDPELLEQLLVVPGFDALPLCLDDSGRGCNIWWSLVEDALVARAPNDGGTGFVASLSMKALGFGAGKVRIDARASATIPDVDGDGIRELVLGAPLALEGRGAVAIVGSADLSPLLVLEGKRAGDQFGSALAIVGGLLHVGAPAAHDAHGVSVGAVYQVDVEAFQTVGALFGTRKGERFGAALSAYDTTLSKANQTTLTDGNNSLVAADDGAAARVDLIVGAPGVGAAFALDIAGVRHATFVDAHATKSFSKSLAQASPSAATGAPRFGAILATADAFVPGGVLVGVPDAQDGAGAVALHASDGRELWRIEGKKGALLGASLVGPRDYNGDGAFVAMFGAPGERHSGGAVYAVDRKGNVARIAKAGKGTFLGASLASPGDISGDGRPDLIVSAAGLPEGSALLIYRGAALVPPDGHDGGDGDGDGDSESDSDSDSDSDSESESDSESQGGSGHGGNGNGNGNGNGGNGNGGNGNGGNGNGGNGNGDGGNGNGDGGNESGDAGSGNGGNGSGNGKRANGSP